MSTNNINILYIIYFRTWGKSDLKSMIKIFCNALKISKAPASTQGLVISGLIPRITLYFSGTKYRRKGEAGKTTDLYGNYFVLSYGCVIYACNY